MLAPVDVRFDVLRRGAGPDALIVSFSHHFESPAGYDAVAYEADAAGIAVAAGPGDRLVLRMTAVQAGSNGPVFIPNADGAHTHGRIPSLTLP